MSNKVKELEKIMSFLQANVGMQFKKKMITYVDNDVRQRERHLGYLRKIECKEDCKTLILGFSDEVDSPFIWSDYEKPDNNYSSITIKLMAKKEFGRNMEAVDFQSEDIILVDLTAVGFVIYRTNARYDNQSIVKTRWIHKIEFKLEDSRIK